MLATLDFEASSMRGYPIEVGVAIYDPGHPRKKGPADSRPLFCSLPHPQNASWRQPAG